ncbi:hypothetical protein C5O25_11920 [Paramuribaculum intestinale]|uniref:MBL fold metallo-hydrolase n=3 Tax=Bacteroidales TaxID=171549 RepID=A0A2V1ITZ8_9BACT|nr:hypothetical protein C5O25_11920 [Paramuribaculum intestinale]ROS84223.1 hypothetical protein EEK90_05090 [Muribaculaceae bacterium Isolate-036 (Harlan)]ROS88073.1 hypothetical protein EEL36_14075 [Muribaculaceae bacterium Isolate-043 (Harlan)]
MQIVERTFYRVGNGLFGMEHTNDIISVYDCGSTNQRLVNNAIDRAAKAYPRDIPIDNIFISHYDKDHVNGLLRFLQEYTQVRRVILPMIPNLTRVINSSSTSNRFLSDFIIDPEAYIRNVSPQTNVIFVDATDRDNNINDRIQDSEEINLSYIENGATVPSRFQIFTINDWIYIIYNRRLLNDAEIATFMKKLGLPPTATTDEIISVLKQKGTSLKKSLDQVLTNNEIENLNDYSMVVWSGRKDLCHGCLYTGDYNAKKYHKELANIYGRLRSHTDIIQIPHHGSINNFRPEICSQNSIHVVSASKGPYKSRQIVNPNSVITTIRNSGFICSDTRTKDITI